MIALGFLTGLWSASRRARSESIPAEVVFDIGVWLIIGGILGGRVLYVITFWRQQFADNPIEAIMIHRGGLVFYGGLLGGILAGYVAIRRKRLPIWQMADVLAPSIAVGYMFGRIGCLFNGCCYGRECALPWAVKYPFGHDTFGHAVHPSQVYDSMLNLLFFLFLNWFFYRRKFEGQVFGLYLVGYAFLRSFVEFFRGDYPQTQIFLGFLTPAHLVSLASLAAGVLLLVFLPKRREPIASTGTVQPAAPPPPNHPR